MGLECILVPGICVGLSPVRPGFVGPAGLCRAGRASSGPPPGFVGPGPAFRGPHTKSPTLQARLGSGGLRSTFARVWFEVNTELVLALENVKSAFNSIHFFSKCLEAIFFFISFLILRLLDTRLCLNCHRDPKIGINN